MGPSANAARCICASIRIPGKANRISGRTAPPPTTPHSIIVECVGGKPPPRQNWRLPVIGRTSLPHDVPFFSVPGLLLIGTLSRIPPQCSRQGNSGFPLIRMGKARHAVADAGRRRCGYVEPVAAPSTRRSNVAAEGSPGTEIGKVDDAGHRSAHRDLTFCEPAAKSGLAELRLTCPRHLETRPPLTTVQSRRRTVNIDPRQNQTQSGIELKRLSSGRGPSGRSRLQRTVGRQTDYVRPF
jgi:hypothetical protein